MNQLIDLTISNHRKSIYTSPNNAINGNLDSATFDLDNGQLRQPHELDSSDRLEDNQIHVDRNARFTKGRIKNDIQLANGYQRENLQSNDVNSLPSRFEQVDQESLPNRLTMLDEPKTPSIESNPRETILHSGNMNTTIARNIGTNLNTHDPSSRSDILSSLTKAQQQQQQQFQPKSNDDTTTATTNILSGSCVILILILCFIIFYGWLTQRRTKTRIRHLKGIIRGYIINDRPNLQSNNQTSRIQEDTIDADFKRVTYSSNKDQYSNANNNETVLLVERSPVRLRAKLSDAHDDAIEVDQSINGCDKYEDDEMAKNSKKRTNRIVILKRRIEKSSLIVAMKSNKPSVKLLSTKIKNFIDDEARQLKEHKDKQEILSLRSKIMSLLLRPLGSSQRDDVEQCDVEICNRIVAQTSATNENNINCGDDNYDDADMVLSEQDCDSDKQATSKVDSDEIELKQQSDSMIQSAKLDLKPTSSSDNPTACSSISGLSMFQQSSSSGSATGGYNNEIKEADVLESLAAGTCLDCLASNPVGQIHNDEPSASKSKSQGNSPSYSHHHHHPHHHHPQQPSMATNCVSDGFMIAPTIPSVNRNQQLTATGNCRSCYSASPTALHNNNQASPATYLYHSASLFPNSSLINSTKQLNRNQQKLPKFSNNPSSGFHLRRNYENYYDDENSDPYHSLTASIGMDLAGLGIQPPVTSNHHSQHDTKFAMETSCTNVDHAKHCILDNTLDYSAAKNFHLASCMNPQSFGAQQQKTSILYCCQNPNDFYQQFIPSHMSGLESAAAPSRCANTKQSPDDMGPLRPDEILALNSVCNDPLITCNEAHDLPDAGCGCHTNKIMLKRHTNELPNSYLPAAPMSIFVQQPSLASRSPSPLTKTRLADQHSPLCMDSIADRPYNQTTPDGSSHHDSGCQYEQPTSASSVSDMGSNIDRRELQLAGAGRQYIGYQAEGQQPYPNRRTSIAGDRISRAIATEACDGSKNQGGSSSARNLLHESQCQHSLAHRASIASSDPQSGLREVNQLHQHRRRLQLIHNHQHSSLGQPNYQHPSYLRSIGIGQMSPVQQPMLFDPSSVEYPNHNRYSPYNSYRFYHRPSDCSSIFDPSFIGQYPMYPLDTKGSVCSSSGGSSSGIGVSGSACTNTPTSVHPMSMNFSTIDSSRPLNWPDYSLNDTTISSQYQIEPLGEFNQHASQTFADKSYSQNNYPLEAARCSGQKSIHHAQPVGYEQLRPYTNISSRKYSLPIQLDIGAERSNLAHRAHRSGLLFSKNNNQSNTNYGLDYLSLGRRGSDLKIAQSSTGMSETEIDMKPASVETTAQDESRRSSQTITRQSSFWLEDGSFDSILSSSANVINDTILVADQQQQQPELQPPTTSIGCDEKGTRSQDIGDPKRDDSSDKDPGEDETQPAKKSDDDDDDDNNNNKGNGSENASQAIPAESESANPKAFARAPVGQMVRLSSSSTSSSGASPAQSPDSFRSRLSNRSSRSLRLTSSNQISKRHQFIRSLRHRRNLRSNSTAETNAGQSTIVEHRDQTGSNDRASKQLKKSCADSLAQRRDSSSRSTETSYDRDSTSIDDGEFIHSLPVGRISDMNSASLERQCRELWKLRATLQNDSCGPDDWSNYHQRLSKRYDSGYKSLEQQLSSSLEGNNIVGSNNYVASSANRNSSDPERPRSGCSNLAELEQRRARMRQVVDSDTVDSRSLVDLVELELCESDAESESESESSYDQTDRDLEKRADVCDDNPPAGGRTSKCSLGSTNQLLDNNNNHQDRAEVVRARAGSEPGQRELQNRNESASSDEDH